MYFNFNTNTPAEPYSGIDAEAWLGKNPQMIQQ